jgi:hypothetical protein
MRLEDHFGSGSQRNERVKLAASFWSNIGAGMVISDLSVKAHLRCNLLKRTTTRRTLSPPQVAVSSIAGRAFWSIGVKAISGPSGQRAPWFEGDPVDRSEGTVEGWILPQSARCELRQ